MEEGILNIKLTERSVPCARFNKAKCFSIMYAFLLIGNFSDKTGPVAMYGFISLKSACYRQYSHEAKVEQKSMSHFDGAPGFLDILHSANWNLCWLVKNKWVHQWVLRGHKDPRFENATLIRSEHVMSPMRGLVFVEVVERGWLLCHIPGG